MLKWMKCKKFDFTAIDATHGSSAPCRAVGATGHGQMARAILQGKHPLIVDGPDENGVTPVGSHGGSTCLRSSG